MSKQSSFRKLKVSYCKCKHFKAAYIAYADKELPKNMFVLGQHICRYFYGSPISPTKLFYSKVL